jgi:alcohol dehydrogenase
MASFKIAFPPLCHTGWGSLEHLVPEAKRLRGSRVLVVADPFLARIGLTDRVTVPLKDAGFHVELYTDVVPEPPLESGEKLVSFARGGGFDLIVGLGGGSALDLAKLAAVLAAHDGKVADYLNLTGTRTIEKRGLPKILIPTTSGTGSEVTDISVLALETTKDVVTHPALVADVAIVDPELTVTVPPRVTAATGIDALTHAVEAYVSVNASPVSDALALHAVRLIAGSLETAVRDGSNRQAREHMSYGSYLAGLAFSNAGVAGVHALAYPLGGRYHMSHGESNAVLLPYVMGYIRGSCRERLADLLRALGGEGGRGGSIGFDGSGTQGSNSSRGSTEDVEQASRACIARLTELVRNVGIPATLGQYSVPESALDILTQDAVQQKRLLARSPLPLGESDIRRIYEAAFKGEIVEP